MTTIYFIRHSVPDYADGLADGELPLTDEGLKRADELVEIFEDIKINEIFSSTYKRAMQTVEPIAKDKNLDIQEVYDFRERERGQRKINFDELIKRMWADFSWQPENGESLQQVQERNIHALKQILTENKEQTLIIGTHGTALSTILNYYEPSFSVTDFMRIADVMPYVIRMDFDGLEYLGKEEITKI